MCSVLVETVLKKCRFNSMVNLEDVVCGIVQLHCVMQTGVSVI